jgi:hypothetical protein
LIQRHLDRFPNAVGLSAKTGEGVSELLNELGSMLRPVRELVELRIPHEASAVVGGCTRLPKLSNAITTAKSGVSERASRRTSAANLRTTSRNATARRTSPERRGVHPACFACGILRRRMPSMSASLRIHDLPAQERPRERLVALGADSLSQAELVAILLRTGTKGISAIHIAQQLLTEFGTLDRLARASLDDLRKVHGIGRDKAVTLKAAFTLARKMAEELRSRRRCSIPLSASPNCCVSRTACMKWNTFKWSS